MDDRLARHLLRRLHHRLEADAIDYAVERGILVERLGTAAGRRLRVFAPGPHAIGKTEAEIAVLLRRHRHAVSSTSRSDEVWADFVGDDSNKYVEEFPSGSVHRPEIPKNSLDITSLLRLVRQSTKPPRPEAVATLLLVAQAITMSATSLQEVLRMLRTPRPIVTIVSRVPGFEQAFLDLLDDGLILPGKVATCPGYGLNRRASNIRFSASGPHWRIVVFSGSDHDEVSDEAAERQVGSAASTTYPILGVTENEDHLPPSLTRAATVRLTCGPVTMQIVRETMRVVLGEEPEGGIAWHLCEALTVTDLALAIRPGVPAGRILDLLEDIARTRIAAATDGKDSGDGSGKKSKSSSDGLTTCKTGRGNPGAGSERIESAKLTGTGKDRHIPRVETLSGYGDAKDWALGLKEDLELWRAGDLAWPDMSTRLLLSGPPGTGKTMFAKAVCNSLRIPLFATSVATWLEPGYLGDVLKRMTKAFNEAEAASPSILFIDEIDGLGTRSSGKDWSDYHNAVVNRALELLDGAAKTAGVVVIGATNRPEAIDPAVIRSGRLEKHVVIPLPTIDALVGILEHHLGDDLAAVVASAPPETFADPDTTRTANSDEACVDPSAEAAPTKPFPGNPHIDPGDGARDARSERKLLKSTEGAHDDTV